MREKCEGFLELAGGEKRALPQVVDFRGEYTDGRACDSMELTCLYESVADFYELQSAVYLTVFYGGAQVFYGLVDELVFDRSKAGGRLQVFARSMAARLMDNQAKELVYAWATWQDIVKGHLAPYGIQVVEAPALPAVANFSVAGGSSEWAVVEKFCGEYGGKKLRVDASGGLHVGDGKTGVTRRITRRHPVTRLRCRVRRYGVYSEVLAFETGDPNPTAVGNPAFAALGGQARRRLTLPRGSGVAARVRSAKRQIDASMELWQTAEITLPWAFAAAVGDKLAVEQLGGDFFVTELTTTPEQTVLVMTREEG